MAPAKTNNARSQSPEPAESTATAVRSFSTPQLLAALFLVSQLIFVLISRFSDDTWRALTPINGLTRYDIHASREQHILEPDEIRRRYGISERGEVGLRPEALQAVIEHREKPVSQSRSLVVRLHTRRADGAEEVWLWPQQ